MPFHLIRISLIMSQFASSLPASRLTKLRPSHLVWLLLRQVFITIDLKALRNISLPGNKVEKVCIVESLSLSLEDQLLSDNMVRSVLTLKKIENLVRCPSVIQLAKLSGFSPIIATASLHNTQLLESLGATRVIDRNTDVPAKVTEILNGAPVELVYDAVSQKDTQEQAWDIVAPKGSLVLVQEPTVDKDKYKDKSIVSVVGNVHYPQVRKLGASLYDKLTSLFESGALKVRNHNSYR